MKVNANARNVTKVLKIRSYFNITLNHLILGLKGSSVEIVLTNVTLRPPSDFTWNPNMMTLEEY